MKKLMVVAVFAMIAIMVVGMLGSGAWFTDQAQGNPANLSTGVLSINDARLNYVQIGTIENMAPGDVTGEAKIVIENNGTLPLAWFGDLIITGDPVLKQAITIDFAQMQFLKPNEIDTWEPTDNYIKDGVGTDPSGLWYNLLKDPDFGVITLARYDGVDGMGTAPYEFMGALKPGYKYVLTLKFGIAKLAGNTYQGLGPVNVAFKVDATQVNAEALDALKSPFSNHVVWLNQQLDKQTP